MEFYEIIRPFYQTCIDLKRNSLSIGNEQYVLSLLLYNVSTLFSNKPFYDDDGSIEEPDKLDYYDIKWLKPSLIYAREVLMNLMYKTNIQPVKLKSKIKTWIDNLANDIWKTRSFDYNNLSCDRCDLCYVNETNPKPLIVTPNPSTNEELSVVKDPNTFVLLNKQIYRGWKIGLMRGFWYNNTNIFELPKLDPLSDDEIEEQSELMLETYSKLTDKQKIVSEYFNNNLPTSMPTNGALVLQWIITAEVNNVPFMECLSHYFAVTSMLLDSELWVWYYKQYYLGCRPVSYIRTMFKDRLITSYVPNKNEPQSILGRQWFPYQKADFVTPPHGEFPVGHSGGYSSIAYLFNYLYGETFYDKTKKFNFPDIKWLYPALDPTKTYRFGKFTIQKGSSIINPSITPADNVRLKFKTWDDWATVCGLSRVYGGIHFQLSVDRSRSIGKDIGKPILDKLFEHKIL